MVVIKADAHSVEWVAAATIATTGVLNMWIFEASLACCCKILSLIKPKKYYDTYMSSHRG